MPMNYTTAIFLISDKVRAISVSYEPEIENKLISIYTFKTLNPEIKIGDYVVVPTNTRHNMTVVKVENVDVEINLEDNVEYKWILDVVDTSIIENHLSQETEAIKRIKKAEKARRKAELRESILADSQADLKSLPIYDAEEPAATPPDKSSE